MPRLSVLGTPLLSGIGDGVSGRWLNATESARQVCGPGGCRIVARVEPDGAERELDGEGANFLAAGFNVWATYLAGRGYKDSYGHTHPSWMPLEVDASGAVLVTDHDSGCGLWLVRPNGQADQLVGSDVMLDVQQGDIDNGVVIYRAGGQLRRWPDGAVFPVTLADPRISNRYLCGGGPRGLWFVPWDQPDRGLLLHVGGDYNPDICALSSGLVRVVSSRTAGEGPGDLQVYDINPVLGTVNGVPAEWRDIREPLPVPDEPLQQAFIRCTPDVLPAGMPAQPLAWDLYAWGTFHIGDAHELSTVLARSVAAGVPSMGYYDQELTPEEIDQIPEALNYVGVKAYPVGDQTKGIRVWSADEVLHETTVVVDALIAARRRPVLWLATYTGSGAWPVALVREVLRRQFALAASRGIDVVLWGIHRSPVEPAIVEDFKALLSAATNVTPPPRPIPVPAPTPAPVPPRKEMRMFAIVPKSRLTPSRTFPGRWLYPLGNGHNLSLDGSTGALRSGGTPNDGDSEALEWDGKSDHGDIAPGNANGLRFPFGVDLTR